MLMGLRTVVYHVEDLGKAKAWYAEMLERAPYFDEPYYVGFEVGGFELGLVPEESGTARGGVSVYWGVEDIEGAYARLLQLGAREDQPVQDVGGDVKVASVIDPFGNPLGVIRNPHFRTEAVR